MSPKIRFKDGKEIEILSCGFSRFETIHIDCVLPFTEVVQMFSDLENISEFCYIRWEEISEREIVQIEEQINCDSVVSIASQFNNWITGDKTVSVVLHGTHYPMPSNEVKEEQTYDR